MADAPLDAIRRRIDGWEAERRAGRQISVEAVAAVATIEQLRALDPGLITRVHALLFDADAAPAAADLEALIDATVRDVLKLKQLDPATPFQNYGLDSISATVLATRLEKALGREIRPQWLIDFSTARALSAHLATRDRHATPH
ncbi:MAG: acyl carrier protein [Burkholderia sp.]